jgi:hypothetical protein
MRFNSLLRSLGNASWVVKFPDTESKRVRLHDKHSQTKGAPGSVVAGKRDQAKSREVGFSETGFLRTQRG